MGEHNRLRIIAGEWRGRKLTFPDRPGLRPTPDRVRETLFNWLQPIVPGARCLDLFAGSGALGWEALSRGAAEVVMVDSDSQVVRNLKEHSKQLAPRRVTVLQSSALDYLRGPAEPFDIVFLDPPFRQGLLADTIHRLESGGWLAPRAWIYMESETGLQELLLPAGWKISRSKNAGQVSYNLAERQPTPSETGNHTEQSPE